MSFLQATVPWRQEPVDRPQAALFWLIVSIGILVRFYRLAGRQLWAVEIAQLQIFSHPTLRENLAALPALIAQAPLDYMLQNVVVTLGGRSDFTARFHAALFGSLSVPLLYWIAKRFLPTREALVAMSLFAVNPLHQQYSQEGRPYALFAFCALCCWCALWKAMESQGVRWWAAYFAATAILLYSNYLAAVVIASQFAFLLCLAVPRVRETLPFAPGRTVAGLLLRFSVSVGAAFLLFTPWLMRTWSSTAWNAPNVFSEWKLALRILKEISGGGYLLSSLLLALLVLGFRELGRNRRWALAGLVACASLLPLPAVLFLDWWRHYFFAVRQVVFAVPILFLGVAAGVEGLAGDARTESAAMRWRLGSVLLVGVVSLGAIYLRKGQEPADWKAVAAYLATNVRTGDLVSAPMADQFIAYYFPDIARLHVDPEQLAARGQDEPSQRGGAEAAGFVVVWDSLPPEQKDAVGRLLHSVEVEEQKSFEGFTVYRVRHRAEPESRN